MAAGHAFVSGSFGQMLLPGSKLCSGLRSHGKVSAMHWLQSQEVNRSHPECVAVIRPAHSENKQQLELDQFSPSDSAACLFCSCAACCPLAQRDVKHEWAFVTPISCLAAPLVKINRLCVLFIDFVGPRMLRWQFGSTCATGMVELDACFRAPRARPVTPRHTAWRLGDSRVRENHLFWNASFRFGRFSSRHCPPRVGTVGLFST